MLALQGLAGNTAVTRLVQRQTVNSRSVLQRDFLDDAAGAAAGVLHTGAGLLEEVVEGAAGLIGAGTKTAPEASAGGSPTGPAGRGQATQPGSPSLREGSTGPAVAELQQRLAALGFAPDGTGLFDDATAAAVRAFQSSAGLVVDGVVGLLTLSGLRAAEAAGPAAGPSVVADIAATKGAKADDGNPADFCKPFPDRKTALDTRDGAGAQAFLFAISAFGSGVAKLWTDYVKGGRGDVQALGDPGILQSFRADRTTGTAAGAVADAVRSKAEGEGLPDGVHQLSAILERSRLRGIGRAMDFSDPASIAGNIAGGVSTPPQTSELIGAIPSPVNDAREITGTATLTTASNGNQFIVVQPHFKVTDTVDFCPGGSGSFIEQQVTVPLSRCEASGVSGDVPFTVDYDSPPEKRGATPPKPRDLGDIDAQPLASGDTGTALSAQRFCCSSCAEGDPCNGSS